MDKLLPPMISGSLPAFYIGKEGTVISVPFFPNKAVRANEVVGLSIKIKTVQSNAFIVEGRTKPQENFKPVSPAIFSINQADSHKFKIGQFYKVQIAYISRSQDQNQDIIGNYSTVGVIKCTTVPTVKIRNFFETNLNAHGYNYFGEYSQDNGRDISEKVLNYEFKIFDDLGNIYFTSGKNIHNSSNDDSLSESIDSFLFTDDLPANKIFYIQYIVYTLNGLIAKSPKYPIVQKPTIDPDIQVILQATLNSQNGYIEIETLEKINNPIDIISGGFLLTRSSEDSNFTKWDRVFNFQLMAETPIKKIWRDYTIEQGKKYKYSLQQYNDNGLYSNRILSNIIFSDFEDIFLNDKEHQLKIKYNPKISSFKNTLLETKVNTLGGTYPFILRNGKTFYKEFPVSGLISYLSDEENLFMKENYNYFSTDLSGENIAKEKQFKLKVLQWLTNGEPKIFRSPTEGNYIVKLMNVSLTPNDTVGRMLHTFSCNAYEISEFTYDNLKNYNLTLSESVKPKQMRWKTINFAEEKNGVVNYKTGLINEGQPAYMVKFINMLPEESVILKNADEEEIPITFGISGTYEAKFDSPVSIILPDGAQYHGSATYSYYEYQKNRFREISNITTRMVPMRQFNIDGMNDVNILKEIETVTIAQDVKKNPKIDLVNIFNLTAQKIPGSETSSIQINDNTISLINEKNQIFIKNLGKPKTLICHKGASLQCGYQINTIDFYVEEDPSRPVLDKKNTYLYMKNELDLYLEQHPDNIEECERRKKIVQDIYIEYIKALIIELEYNKGG